MTTLKMLILSAAALGAGGAATLLQQPGCATTAQALRIAGEIDAQSDFWETLAAIANEPGNHAALLQEARDARDEALELAEDRFEARMALCGLFGPGVYRPALLPGEFSSAVTNQYFPLVAGRKLIYEKHAGPDVERVEIETQPGTKAINGFACAIVRDVVFLNGVLHEDTHDWFAQRNDGSVWYFGEIALNFDEDGELADVEGSWRYGRDGAQPGIAMPANPQVGDAYRQEYFIGEAEDVGRVIAAGVTISVPAGVFHNCIVTQDGSPLEPDASEHKFYAPGVGLVMELDPSSGETLELIQIQ